MKHIESDDEWELAPKPKKGKKEEEKKHGDSDVEMSDDEP